VHFCPGGPVRHDPAPSALENDAIDLHFVLLPSGAEHREFLGLNEVIHGLIAARALAHSARCAGFAKLLGHAGIVVGLPGPANGIRGPIIGRRIAVGVEDFGLQIADERLDFGAGIRPPKTLK
jgi:hypothetical protein